MKKYFLLLLFTAITLQAQTTGVTKLKITSNPENTTATRVMVQDATTKEVGYVTKNSLETPNATTTTLGKIQLSGDLGGTATSPTIPGLVNKVDKEAGKGLSSNDYTTADKTKLSGIASGAEVNVNADWNASSGDAQILNKPIIPSISGLATETYVNSAVSTKENTITAGTTSQYWRGDKSWQTLPAYTLSGLGGQPLNSDLTAIAGLTGTSGFLKKTAANTWDLDTNSYLTGITSANVTSALGYTPYNSTNPNGYISGISFTAVSGKPTTLSGYGITDGQTLITSGTTSQYYRGDKTWQTLDKTSVGLGNVDNTTDAAKPVSTATQTALNLKENTSSKNVANGYAGLGADGKLISNQLPAIAITDTYVINTQAAMLALTAETGDVAIRTDLNKSYILQGATASVLGNWQELLSPTGGATSVFGRTGSVVANAGDYNTSQVTEIGNLYYTDARVNANANVSANTAARHNAVTIGTANGLSLSTQVLSLGLASSTSNGALSSTDWNTFNGKQNALGFTPYNSTNPSGYITGLSWAGLSSKPTTLAGFGITDAYPLSGNPSGFLTGISSAQVTGALGFTPYNSTNPNGYITSTGSITGSAGSVAWTNVSGRPTNVSSFTNDSGYINTSGARTALSFTAGSGAYNSSTGVITIPTNTNQLTNGAGFITGSYLPLSGGTVSGTITATAFYASSDRRLKNIISRSGDMIEFTWKDKRDNKTHFGYVAQEVRKKMPEQVNRDEQGYMSVNYIEVLVAKVNALELEVKSLKEKLK
jgi:hypothetical protein